MTHEFGWLLTGLRGICPKPNEPLQHPQYTRSEVEVLLLKAYRQGRYDRMKETSGVRLDKQEDIISRLL